MLRLSISVLIILVTQILFVSCIIHSKCCNQSSEIKEIDGILQCRNRSSNNQRHQIYSRSFNFLSTTNERGDGKCVDTDNGQFFIYHLRNGTSQYSSKESGQKTFVKCCPLGHLYNMKTRACKWINSTFSNPKDDFITESFVEIGLPHCRVILDTKYPNLNAAMSTLILKEKKSYCLDQIDEDLEDLKDSKVKYVIRECQNNLEICKEKRCFKKCCPDGQSYVGGGICRDTFIHGFQINGQTFSPYIEQLSDDYELIYGVGCKRVSIIRRNNIQYSFQKNGNFRYFYNYSGEFREEHISDTTRYCIEYAEKGNISNYSLFTCFSKPIAEKFVFTLISKIASCIFLFITMAIYFYLKETKTNFGKILLNYCLTMMLLMITLIVSHVYLLGISRLECKTRAKFAVLLVNNLNKTISYINFIAILSWIFLGYLILFFNSASFAWVNVMSIDIWCTFSTPSRTIGYAQKRQDTKKFIMYLLYGWGLPICHVVIIVLFERTSVLPQAIQPYVGEYYCFLENRNYARLLFFLTPLFIFQVISTILFVKTVIYCLRVKNEINKMSDSTKNREYGRFAINVERLGLIFKLAVIMGIIWIIEISTAFISQMSTYSEFTKILEIVLDNIICMQGIFIFIIFICKKKTINKLRKRIGFRRQISSSMSDTQMIQMTGQLLPMHKRQTIPNFNTT